MVVCVLLTHVPNPRINKRIESIKEIADVHVICIRRPRQDLWDPSVDVKHIVYDIDLPDSKNLIKRLLVSRSFQKKALKAMLEIKPDVIYTEGLDTLMIACKYIKHAKAHIFFEVADLRESYIIKPKGVKNKVLTSILLNREKQAFKQVELLVVTSPKFYEMHYSSLIPAEKALFIPNAPEQSAFLNYQKKKDGTFTIGFIGGIRYIDQMKMLVDAANSTDCRVLFAGGGFSMAEYEEIMDYCQGMPNIQFTGKYDYKTEIAGLYGMVDCVYAVYNADNPNVRIALPNKLYECILCGLPILVAKGTYLSQLVDEWGVGVSVDHKRREDLVNALNQLKTRGALYQALTAACEERKNVIDTSVQYSKLKAYIRDSVKQ